MIVPQCTALLPSYTLLDTAWISRSQPLCATTTSIATNSRITQALLELQAAESLLAESRIRGAILATPQPIPSMWLVDQIRASSCQHKKVQAQAASSLVTLPKLTMALPLSRDVPLSSTHSIGSSRCASPSLDSPKTPMHAASPGGLSVEVELRDTDILCGRGGRSNHHVGNKRFRKVVSQMKASYKTIGSKTAKTELSRAIVDHVHGYGGRFLKHQDKNNNSNACHKNSTSYVVLSAAEARKKTSQALREAKIVKWTA